MTRPESSRDKRQRQAAAWAESCFGREVVEDRRERVTRILEEAIELAQAEGLDVGTVARLSDRVFAKPPGVPRQELGGLGVCLLVYAEAAGVSADAVEAEEVAAVLTRDPAHFRDRQNAKAALGLGKPCEERTID
ncbi:MAG: hypothetical protein FJX55_15060 [Alphaproteobacteria bacterium]|nr:hypothetical protein [Alphaproteobacteria bacterium]